MTWSNLLSGFIGGLVGGVLSLAAAFMTIRHDRSQARQDTSRSACNVIKHDILTIRNAIWTMVDGKDLSESRLYALLAEIHAATQDILYVKIGQVDNEKLRSRINDLIDVVVEWYENARESPTAVDQKLAKAIESHTASVLSSIEDYLADKKLTSDQSPPDLPAMENA
jgi:hypothetical protein